MFAGQIRSTLALGLGAAVFTACQTAPPPETLAPPAPTPAPVPSAAAAPGTAPQVIEVTAIDYAFQAPDVVPSGWTTMRFRNDGEEHHMVFLTRLPEGKTMEEYETEVSMPFSRAWQARQEGRAGEEEALGMIFGALPDWFSSIGFPGGPGLAGPGVTSEMTLNLEPGNYVLECYVKAADGTIHYMDGMLRPMVVSESRADAPLPDADIQVTLSNFDMMVEGDLTPGRRTVAVRVAENPEEGFGHSVHVARMEPGTDVQQVVDWLNWLAEDGYQAPAPAHFIGGSHPMPVGDTAYFTVDLEPGRYLFVSEATGAQGVRREITVP